MNVPGVRVIKLGGSLLSLPDLAERFSAWISTQPAAANVIVVGGGALVDAVRELDRTHHLGQRTAHLLAARCMSVTARLVSSKLPDFRLTASYAALRKNLEFCGPDVQPPGQIFDAADFLEWEEPTLAGDPLPWSWQVTSDSIAARLATLLEADELVLLKSCLPTETGLGGPGARSEYTDAFFSSASRRLSKVRCVNLRADASAAALPES